MLDEQEAIRRLKRGDIGGLEVLVSRYQMKAVRTAYLITRDPALAEDVVQDCRIIPLPWRAQALFGWIP